MNRILEGGYISLPQVFHPPLPRCQMKLPVAAWFLLLCAAFSPLHGESPFAFYEVSPTSLGLTEKGKPVLVYNHGMMLKPGVSERYRRSSYLHPLHAPDGTVLTDDFPPDHYHQRGVSWMWPVVKVDDAEYNLWELRGGIHHRFLRWTERETAAGYARLGVENAWQTDQRAIVRERVEILIHAAAGNRRQLDFTLTLEAIDGAVEIAGTPSEQKGYGGFCIRFAPNHQTQIRTDRGKLATDAVAVHSEWAELQGIFEDDSHAGVRLKIDSSNPGYPNRWILRHYGLLGVSFPGLNSYTLLPGQPLVMKYQIDVFSAK